MSQICENNFFLPYQISWIKDSSDIKLMEKARQIGISWSSAYSCVRRSAITRLDTWISSRDENQANLFVSDCKKFAKILQIAISKSSKKYSILTGKAKTSNCVLEFANGSKIHSLSSNPDAQAGKRGSRLLDEFALHPDPQKLYAISYPGITWGGQLEIISTHRGSQNFFNQLIQEIKNNGNPKKISYHRVTLENALNQGFLKKLKHKLSHSDKRFSMTEAEYFDFVKNSCPDEETFLQEYMCVPCDYSSSFLPMEYIERCFYKQYLEINLNDTKSLQKLNDCYLGVDIGRNHDLTVFWLLEKTLDTFFTRKVICLKDTPFKEQEAVLKEFCKIPSLRRICIDQTGIGRQFVEQAQQNFGKYRVEGITFTNSLKEVLAYNLRTVFENNAIRIPDTREISSDLRAIKKEVTSAGNIRFGSDRGKNGHSDRFWALSLALHAEQNNLPNAIYLETMPKIRPKN